MTTEFDYRQRISQYSPTQLIDLWEQIQTKETPDWDPGKALEYVVLRAFEIEGAAVTYPFFVRMGGAIVEQIDGAVYSDHLSCLVECKDQESNITIDPVAKLRNQLLRRPAGIVGLVFSSSSFTASTLILAQYSASQSILLFSSSMRHPTNPIAFAKVPKPSNVYCFLLPPPNPTK
jgi:hypothetical protein